MEELWLSWLKTILFPSLTAFFSILKTHFKSLALWRVVFMAYFETETVSVQGPDVEPYQVSHLRELAAQMAARLPTCDPSTIKCSKRNKSGAKCWSWWCTPLSQKLGRLRQEDGKFKTRLGN